MKKKKITPVRWVRYICEYVLVVITLGIFSLMSIKTASNVAGRLGRIFGRISVCFSRGRIAYANIRRVFPEKSDAEAMAILITSYENIFRFAAEYVHQEKIDEAWINENVSSEGLEHIEFLHKERGVHDFIAITGHVGNWEPLHRFLRYRCG